MSSVRQRTFHEPEDNELLALDAPEPALPTGAPVASAPVAPDPRGLYLGLARALLEQIEDGARRLVAHGFEDELRARLANILPEQPTPETPSPAPPLPGASDAHSASAPMLPASVVDRILNLQNAAYALATHARQAKRDSATAKRDAHLADCLRAEIEILKGGAR
ncbi:MAG: hypothetical protein AB7S70_02540 [Hyphomicrobium sp.]|uniref:hypothetical protein n=1 Tax=Hyphomicrobium sp. TaxID=82 RepID=UPI003D0B7094